MNKYGGMRIPLINNPSNIRVGYRKETRKSSDRYGCMIGASIDWVGEDTVNCESARDCLECNCILHVSNYDAGMKYLVDEGIITKERALAFVLEGKI